FTYTLRDAGLDDVANNADDLTGTGTVTINVNTPKVWYVDDSYAGVNGVSDGTALRPFTSLATLSTGGAADALDGANDIIYIKGTGTNYTSGIVLEAGQQLIGSGVALVVGGQTLAAAGTAPTITNGSGAGITLATDNTLRGFTVGNTSTVDIQDGNSTVGTLNISNVSLLGTGQALDVDQGGTLNVSLDAVTSTSSTGQGIQLLGLGGTFAVAGAVNISGNTGGP